MRAATSGRSCPTSLASAWPSSTRSTIPGSAWSAPPTAAASSSSRRRSTTASTRWSRRSPGTRWGRACTGPARSRRAGGALLRTGSQVARLDPHIRRAYHSGQSGGRLIEERPRLVQSPRPGRARRTRSARPRCSSRARSTRSSRSTRPSPTTRSCAGTACPPKMLWFCGGHGVCLTKRGKSRGSRRDTLRWLSRYLKRQPPARRPARASSGVDQNGVSASARDYPLRHLEPRDRAARPQARWR